MFGFFVWFFCLVFLFGFFVWFFCLVFLFFSQSICVRQIRHKDWFNLSIDMFFRADIINNEEISYY
ncbi:MAG: hypothetical protein CMP10_07225 [Zetaproteobacteria bacterium]|nr:hypothetical protein [Pseudobdellovibrionaceae bacterium]